MNRIILSSTLPPEIARFTSRFVNYILDQCDPRSLVNQQVNLTSIDGPTHVLGFGKAAVAMSQACAAQLKTNFAGGVVLGPETLIPQSSNTSLRYFPVDHPLPTQRNIQATKALVDYAQSISSTDNCIVCISGGGSAHLCSPRNGVSLEQIIESTKTLNNRGATIHELNHARRSLEVLKAGGLARLLNHVESLRAVVLSDVLDDDLDIIASGPMMEPEHPIEHTFIGNHQTALSAAERFFDSCVSSTPQTKGDSQQIGRALAGRFITDSGTGTHLAAGESTVDVGDSDGIGGPCMEMVLSAALTLNEQQDLADWMVIGFATDGIDGPTDAAGAVLTAGMISDDLLPDIYRAFGEHNVLPILDQLGATIRTGATGTNLNDLCVVCPMSIVR